MKIRKTFGLAAVGMLGVGMLGACATEAPPATTLPGGNETTTTTVTLACSGAGIIGPGGAAPVGPIANQAVDIDVTLPTSAAVGSSFNVGVDVGNIVLSAAPGFLNLNAANVSATIYLTGASNPNFPVTNFVGNGASVNLIEGIGAGTTVAGTNTVSVGQIDILAGTTGFTCSPVGTPASGSFASA